MTTKTPTSSDPEKPGPAQHYLDRWEQHVSLLTTRGPAPPRAPAVPSGTE